MIMAKTDEQIDIRDAFFDSLYDIAARDRDVIFLTADMTAFSLGKFRKDLPDQYFNVGVAEQNLIGVAAGLALSGKKVFVYAIAPFVTQRCFEQIKVDLCVMNLPVTLIGTGPGICYSSDGPTHHTIEDLGMMRGLPRMTIYNPADPVGAAEAARMGLESDGPVYVRLDKGAQTVLHPDPAELSDGLITIRPGKNMLILSTGLMVYRALEVADELQTQGIDAAVAEAFRIKPFNEQRLVELAAQTGRVVTLEEHSIIGGLGSAVAETLADHGRREPLLRLAMPDAYPTGYGDREWMLEQAGLDSASAVERIMRWMEPGYSESISAADFARVFGATDRELPPECLAAVEKHDFRYEPAADPERERLLLRASRVLDKDLTVSGPHRLDDWERGWRENLEEFRHHPSDPDAIVPKFVKKIEYIRFQGNYILPANPDFETAFVTVLRNYLFRTFFEPFGEIHEFGCGPGHNLKAMAELFPDKKLVGLDWSESGCELVEHLADRFGYNLSAVRFDMFTPDSDYPLGPQSAVFTTGAMEQLGTDFHAFLNFLLDKQPGICVHVETTYELYDRENLFDYLAAKYLEKRGYLRGYLTRLRELEKEGRIQMIDVRRTFGSFFHDGYSFIVWKPASAKM
ncbi:MAG: transketolase C-terminal domain-containing protein [Pseudomonadota bacterium]